MDEGFGLVDKRSGSGGVGFSVDNRRKKKGGGCVGLTWSKNRGTLY